MWKYVSRRVKETFEHKCKVLNVHKSGWVCGASQHYRGRVEKRSRDAAVQHQGPDQIADSSYVCIVVANRGECDVPYLHCENWERTRAKDHQQRRHCPISNLLSAISWSGAIVFGWYASQLVCLNRRHEGWQKSQSRYWQMLQAPTRAVHSSFLSHLVLTSPNYPSLISERVLLEKFATTVNVPEEKSQVPQPIIFDVSNDTTDGCSTTSNESQKQSVGEAVADLVSFLGETEYKMGVKSITAGQFRQAVAHLKLATSHNHPGATFNLGLCYEKGLGVTKNLKRAMECYQIASSLGHPKAMFNLGVFYARGLGGLEKDNQAAKKCFVTAAQLGQAEAIDALGGYYDHRPSSVYDDRKSDMPPMTELIFEKSKAELFTAAAKFT